MRGALVFSGSSHPRLVDGICDRLGQSPGQAELRKFSNGETSVQIQTSIRDKDVFIVQSGSSKINDNVMELLIMIAACKGGSAKSITAVLPYFPYCRMSKKKSHRGAITARMLANLLSVAGVDHVITIDLHASQMQGFFRCPVDNLVAEPLISRWIRNNISNWREAVVVSKNPGGTKRVTSLADALKISFGIVTTERRRPQPSGLQSMAGSTILEAVTENIVGITNDLTLGSPVIHEKPKLEEDEEEQARARRHRRTLSNPMARRLANGLADTPSSPLAHATLPDSESPGPLTRATTVTTTQPKGNTGDEEYTDERARDVITGRLIHGHIVDEDFPSPTISAMSGTPALSHRNTFNTENDDDQDPMTMSFVSQASSVHRHGESAALGGSIDAAASSDEEEEDLRNPELEATVTLVGNVKDRPVLIVDDMIDKSGSWIAAAETVVKRGGATKVYCMATHGLFGNTCLEEMEACDCIDRIVVTNAFPIPPEKVHRSEKLVVLDVANLLAEAVRRNHHGESMSQLFSHDE